MFDRHSDRFLSVLLCSPDLLFSPNTVFVVVVVWLELRSK